MKRNTYILFLILIIFESCAQGTKQKKKSENVKMTINAESSNQPIVEQIKINPSGSTIEKRILPPTGFTRIIGNDGSFAKYLRNLPLKPHGSEVLLYDGSIKTNYNTYDAVIDMEIGNKDLHQCADAVMRLRAEYLWNHKRYNDIHFNFTNGFRVDYSKWMEGKRMVVKGNETYWVDKLDITYVDSWFLKNQLPEAPSNTYQDFWEYMELIFNYAGTLSLSKELIPVDIRDMKIGDVFIWGGSPGHAILVMDIAENSDTKEKTFLLAQSYMPAQETQILQNPNNSKLSPWYSVTEISEELNTPEWTFSINDLKRFKE
tara:strand:- start:110 stop:1060 length:951 start_codon:yes stop_codon:yes gene_type:complete